MVARKAAVVAVAVLAIVASPFSATAEPDTAPGAIGGTVALAALSTILCWTADAVERRSEATPEPDGAESGERPEAGFDRRGWLVGIDGSFGIQNFKEQEESDLQDALKPFETSITMKNNNTGGVSGRLGYRCNRRVSAEIQIAWLDDFKGALIERTQREIAAISLRPIFTSINARGYLLTGRYQPYLLVGAGALTIKSVTGDVVSLAGSNTTTNTMFTMRMGFGVEVYATKHVVVDLGASYVLPVTGIDTFEYITIDAGIEYRF